MLLAVFEAIYVFCVKCMHKANIPLPRWCLLRTVIILFNYIALSLVMIFIKPCIKIVAEQNQRHIYHVLIKWKKTNYYRKCISWSHQNCVHNIVLMIEVWALTSELRAYLQQKIAISLCNRHDWLTRPQLYAYKNILKATDLNSLIGSQ